MGSRAHEVGGANLNNSTRSGTAVHIGEIAPARTRSGRGREEPASTEADAGSAAQASGQTFWI
ncbi:hypothetical protein GCM10009668_14910 [Nocardioides dubius]|uniref:Uncharacterized protein n=1 Tax=Nocardioides dubius TaxID=317019 RepID=A0ABP4EC60_9ACTN